MMDRLEILLREYGFRGRARRVRCFAHTLNLVAKATVRQFERKKGTKKRRTEDDDVTPDFDELPLLEPIDVGDESDDEDGMDLTDLEEIPDTADEEGPEEAAKDEEEIVNVFETLTEEEQARWRVEVMPIRSALFKVSLQVL